MRKNWCLWVMGLSFTFLACTNLQLGQTLQRYKENMSGALGGFSNLDIADSNNFSFAAMGDTHIGATGGDVMQRAVQRAKSDGDSFVVIAGDDSNTGLESELRTFKSQLDAIGLPYYPAIGNHDIFFGGWEYYKTVIGRSIYTVTAGCVQFIFLDTANGTFGEEQLNWLKLVLDQSSKSMKVVITHFPAFIGTFSSIFKLSSDEEATLFKNLMDQYNVQLVISGHYHGYGDKMIGKTRHLVTGGANGIIDIGEKAHYLKITVQNGSSFDVRQIDL